MMDAYGRNFMCRFHTTSIDIYQKRFLDARQFDENQCPTQHHRLSKRTLACELISIDEVRQ